MPAYSPCRSHAEVDAALVRFASAFNTGDAAAIRATLSPELWALAFAVRGNHEGAYTRDGAVRYVLERQRAGDRLDFRRVQVSSLVAEDGAAHFVLVEFLLRRNDAPLALLGKGALYCGGRASGIKVLSLVGN